MPVFSLPSPHGGGCFSREVLDFIDWLAETGHSLWQILPLNPVDAGNSPYLSPASFGGNIGFIDLEALREGGLLKREELFAFVRAVSRIREKESEESPDPSAGDAALHPAAVNQGEGGLNDADSDLAKRRIFELRQDLLRKAYERARAEFCSDSKSESGSDPKSGSCGEDFAEFCRANEYWLEDYAMFMALREQQGTGTPWTNWPEAMRIRDAAFLDDFRRRRRDELDFHRWTQFIFDQQWQKIRTYAHKQGIQIVGDLPIYVSMDSADCWADPGQFQLDENLEPRNVGGVPPDYFSPEGQKWGNPLYDWDRMRADGYRWWKDRIRRCFALYDVLRLDHFRGFASYYSIPAGEETAAGGHWEKGPGMDLFRCLDEEMPEKISPQNMIAEDLGTFGEDVHELLRETRFPGMKVLQFAFDDNPENPYLPENYGENCVVYTGTHDNDTTAGWFEKLSSRERIGILQYLGLAEDEAKAIEAAGRPQESACPAEQAAGSDSDRIGQRGEDPAGSAESSDPAAVLAVDRLIEKALESRADLVIIPIQDYLHLGSEARINTPGTVGGNWNWAAPRSVLSCGRRRDGSHSRKAYGHLR